MRVQEEFLVAEVFEECDGLAADAFVHPAVGVGGSHASCKVLSILESSCERPEVILGGHLDDWVKRLRTANIGVCGQVEDKSMS